MNRTDTVEVYDTEEKTVCLRDNPEVHGSQNLGALTDSAVAAFSGLGTACCSVGSACVLTLRQ